MSVLPHRIVTLLGRGHTKGERAHPKNIEILNLAPKLNGTSSIIPDTYRESEPKRLFSRRTKLLERKSIT
jgi:hypothetical protein